MMVETDWKEILSFSQKELKEADKEKLCESLSWMEPDDIELNFADIKTLFRLAQDMLKFKNEQAANWTAATARATAARAATRGIWAVLDASGRSSDLSRFHTNSILSIVSRKSLPTPLPAPLSLSLSLSLPSSLQPKRVKNLAAQISSSEKKSKGKSKKRAASKSEEYLETIAHQEEVIKANKEIIETLQAELAELEVFKKKSMEGQDVESESSRSVLSELNALRELENEVSSKNRHIRKLIGDIKLLENENTAIKEKTSVLKEKLTEATLLIENLTQRLFSLNNDNEKLKDLIGAYEETKTTLNFENEILKKELIEKESTWDNVFEEIQAKVQHWKNVAKSSRTEILNLASENEKLKDSLQVQSSRSSPKSSPKKSYEEKLKIKELQEKLSQATSEIFSSANLIENLSKENKKLKSCLEEMPDYSVSDTKNESDEGKERALIIKLKREIKSQKITMRGMEDMISEREKELTEIASQLQLLQSDDGIKKLLSSLKFKTKQIQSKDQGIKTLVQEINTLSQDVDNLQIENKILRDKLNIQPDTVVPNKGILKKYNDMEKLLGKLQKERTINENKITDLELHNRELTTEINKFTEFMLQHGFSSDIISTISHNSEEMLKNVNADLQVKQLQDTITKQQRDYANQESELKEVIEQNEGLRKSLSELLNFLKDNSSTTSGVLALECPSLEAVLKSMEARNTAGWFAPHMSTMIELREAKGGRDALLTALHDARKETFDIMNKLSSKSQKCSELEQKLLEMNQTKTKENERENTVNDTFSIGEFGSWMLNDDETNRDLYNEHTIENIIIERNSGFEKQLQNNLLYFNNKFQELYQKMTAMAIQATNDQNNWNIQEEQYRAEIEKLKMFIQDKDDSDMSENSPGIVSYPNTSILQRKCSYLQESYKYCKALHENIKNEFTEFKIESIKATVHYEIDIQKLLLTINKLNDKLRNSVTFELFKKQNIELNEKAIKYREIMESNVKNIMNSQNIAKLLESNKAEIIDQVYKTKSQSEGHEQTKVKNILNDVELSVLQNQLKQVCQDLEKKEEELRSTQSKLVDLQNNYGTIIDQTLGADSTSDSNFLKEENQKLTDQNAILKEQCRHQQNQLNIALIQLQDSEHKQLNVELETNMLKHQILDLQSTGDNKAIIARLSNEVLVAHLQATENYTKIERLNALLRKEKEMRVETEDMLQTRERVFEVYSNRYESKFKYMYELMHILRQQYQGCLPLLSIENYFNNYEECCRKTISVNAKLNEIDDLKDNLMTKHSIYDHVLEASKNKCLDDEDVCCHKLQLTVAQGTRVGELEHLYNKISSTEKSRDKLLKYCNHLEKTLVFLSQGYERSDFEIHGHKKNIVGTRDYVNKLEIEDVQSDDDSISRKSQTISLPKPLLLKPSKSCIDMTKVQKEEVPNLLVSPSKTSIPSKPEIRSIMLQTSPVRSVTRSNNTQTDEDHEVTKLRNHIEILENDKQNASEEIMKVNNLNKQLKYNLNEVKHEKDILQSSLRDSQRLVKEKEQYIQNLKHSLEHVQRQADKLHDMQLQEIAKSNETNNDEDNSLLMIVKQLEEEKEEIISEYKKLLQNERDEFSNAVKELQQKVFELQSNSNKKSEPSVACDNLVASVTNKYSQKIAELEHKCFKIQNELDVSSTELQSCRSEMERWKSLAGDRLLKLESLNSQLESRHTQEVDSYKAENQHWLSQLNESQREHTELRTRLSEQKSAHVKTIAEKDAHIDHLRSVINNLKTQILNMQTVISVNDPSFDLSAIVEVEEMTDAASQYGSDRLEIKFDSSEEFHDGDGVLKPQASSTVIWQEPVIDRLRREKQQASKQNTILRRQIKALAARERRARLDAQNLKHQVFRISTSGKKLPTVELSTLHSKIASLQTQLTSARRDTQSSIALWDKWKRAQQSSDRWQSRFEEKSQEVRKLEAAMNLARGAVSRLEKEKRVLLQRLTEATNLASDNPLRHILSEKQDGELSEKSARCEECARAPVSARALLDRVEAQQRRIAALEIAERGNEYLVSEYEKSLAEVASLKGQVLKLESALLESQIQVPIRSKDNTQPELEYWKSYCEMLKEENVQLTLRVNSMDSSHLQPGQHKISDLEQTVLTLRGLVSKLQAEQKSGVHRRIDSRPSSGISTSEKSRSQLESHRIEIANLKRSIQDKDLLLERSKEMLKIAADREDELLRENTMLRRRLEELIKPPSGFLSA